MKQQNVAMVIFPFAANSMYAWACKASYPMANAAEQLLVIGGKLPADVKWPQNATIRDFGVRLHYVKNISPYIYSLALWFVKLMLIQILIAREIYRVRHQVQVVYFAMGVYYQFPLLVSKLLRKKVICGVFGNPSRKAKASYGSLISRLIFILERSIYKFVNVLVIEGSALANYDELSPYREKIMDGALFLDQSGTFKVYSEYSARQNCVGLVGRLFDEKGIREFIQAIPGILHWNKNVSFMIIGTGNLDQEVEKLLSTPELEQQVTWIRGVPHDEVSKYLNTMRLLVVPSTDEGLPMIILEALGCGTPVLATPVGCIPDVIHDQETGFILPDNAPETIEQGVIRAMSHSDLSRIISNGLDLLHKNYSLESSTARYRNILNSLNQA